MSLWAASERQTASPAVPVYMMNAWFVFGGFCVVYLFFNWYLQTQVLTDQVYTYSFGGKITPDKLAAFLDGQHRSSVIGYLVIPVVMLFKMALVSVCIYAGLVLTSQSIPFSRVFRIVLFAEAAFVAGTLLRLMLLAFLHSVESFEQYIAFAPLSLFSLFPAASVPGWLVGPLQTLDLFQVGYVCLLARGLQYYQQRSFRASLRMVAGSYGVGLAVCIIGFAFIAVIYNP
jgi:hypothetical protein